MTKPFFIAFFVLVATFNTVQAQSNSGSTIALELNPGNDNPRNSEGDFVTLKDGRILFVYSHYTGGSTSDHAPAYLAGRFSKDGGKTWTQQDQIIVAKEGDMNVMSVSLLRLKNGKIALFYLKKNSEQDCIPQMRLSADEAKSWSEPIPCITDKQGYFVLNNSRVIQLSNGRLLMAVAQHQSPGGKWQGNGTLYSYYSDDNGATWKASEAVPKPAAIVTQEPGVIELKNGTIMMFIRASGGVQQLSYSKDKGQSWSPIEPSTLKSPLSPASIARIPSTGDLLVVWNNNDGSNPEIKDKRTPLSVAISKDDGKTWQHIRTIETDPDGWYCYIAIHFTKKDALLGYCAGSQKKVTHLSTTRINRLNLASLYQ
ncbi:hypothetical protein GCM10028803_54630 [Larkinella knui]|uniref:Exo-alpha-sialidase n=1 Tax=Larkinella knui TaxID=2025310 RepID=A0A3P1CHH8_9BACT|nr:sialidase family protein [Larkinella knui]RRB12334.1 exo-alpha-sialidase [Larkinella knui]